MRIGNTLRICLIAHCRYPIREPFAGGLEAMTYHLARELVRRGHEVSVFAAPGSDPTLGVTEIGVRRMTTGLGRQDVHPGAPVEMAEHHAYLGLMLDLAAHGADRFDVVHNNSLHHLPVAMARALHPLPVLTTLHTPPVWWLESAAQLDEGASAFTAVSQHTARAWAHILPSQVVPNGVDLARWPEGPGGQGAVWSGRIVPEKAPHEAIDAARRAGMPLVLAGPVLDEDYFRRQVAGRLGGTVTYAGHLSQDALARVVGSADVALVTPAWDEPYGLVAAEALACGTPVAGYARGGVPDVVGETGGRLVRPGDELGLADAVLEAASLDRSTVRQRAEQHLSLTRMVDAYERCYGDLLAQGAAA